MSSVLCPACVVVMLVLTAASAQEIPRDQPPIWSAKPDVVAFEKMENDRLAAAQRAIDPVVAVKSPRTIENTLAPYDEATRQRNAAIYFSTLVRQVYRGAAYRDRATAMTTKVSSAQRRFPPNRQIYLALAALDVAKADPAMRYCVQWQLLEFHPAGVDKVPQRPCPGFLLHRRMDCRWAIDIHPCARGRTRPGNLAWRLEPSIARGSCTLHRDGHRVALSRPRLRKVRHSPHCLIGVVSC